MGRYLVSKIANCDLRKRQGCDLEVRTRALCKYLPYAFTEHGALMAANVLLPKLYAAGWNDDQINEQRTLTDGRIGRRLITRGFGQT